jgi:hypothetical protein
METNRLNQGEMIAAVSAIALFLIMFIFDWFGNDFGGADAWQSFSFIDIVLFITILVAIGGAVVTASAQSVNTPVAISAITTALGILCVLLILFRIIDPPDFGTGDAIQQANDLGIDTSGVDIGTKIGVWLGLIAAGGIAFGGWRAMQEEGTSFRGEGDRLQNRPPAGGGTPPPPPPPAGGNPPPSGGTGV